MFKYIEDRDLDRSRVLQPTPITELPLAEYSYERLEQLSEGFTRPVVVRGLFSNSSAVRLWKNCDYLAEQIGHHEVNVVQNGSQAAYHWVMCHKNKLSDWAHQEAFDDAIKEIGSNSKSLKTIVLPPASRSKRVRNAEMESRFNAMANRDLDLPRIGGGFASGLKNTVLTQMFAGNGVEGEKIGSGWHCDICNNFVVQVTGFKEWIFVRPEFSKYMRVTMQHGKTAIGASHRSLMEDTLPFLPKQRVLLSAGDFLFNPDWEWHAVLNPPGTGFTMGLVSRECHFGRTFKANPIFTSIVLGNHLIAATQDKEAAVRLWSALTGESLMVNETQATGLDAVV
jgi:hypothetical protein